MKHCLPTQATYGMPLQLAKNLSISKCIEINRKSFTGSFRIRVLTLFVIAFVFDSQILIKSRNTILWRPAFLKIY